MIKQHFQNELIKRGYPENLTIEYSLGYCQGDGMAFYGDLGVDDVKALMKRLFSTELGQIDDVSRVRNLMVQEDIENMLFVLRECGSCDLSITRNSYGNHYSHWNCMNIDDKVDFTGIFSDEDTMLGTGIEGINQKMVERWQDNWDSFVLELVNDVKSISKKLQSDGYSLIEASPCEEKVVWKRATKNFLVRVTELPERDFYMAHWDWDDEVRDQVICSILEGNERVLGLRVEVLSRENEIVLGEESLYGLIVDSNDKSYAGYRYELLRGAIQQTRDFFSRHLKMA
ncbi:NgrC [Photorhabdus luminescens subsp. mexicana]|uniref:NgrC n=1 Tax=Photorhabdus luminescens subsp. mexicana TaxID=2100167 RepID=A0A4R4IU09_PHOLU|nr:NgrC [Photorhabdus luminescens]TDB44294.1 NgrC [Photorhabdus luminescens subsp. mexicana]